MAVLMVFVCHIAEVFWFLKNPWRKITVYLWAGWTGTDLFFVLSGFLITGILWESREAPHYFKNFYARRTLRLFPLYYTTLIIIFLLLPFLVHLLEHRSLLMDDLAAQLGKSNRSAGYWLWFYTYSADFLFATKDIMFPAQFWSLAVEEHFYLLWPLLIHRLNHNTLIKVTGVIAIGTLMLRFCLYHFVIPYGMFCLTFCRMDGLAMGAMIALIMRNKDGISTLKQIARVAFPVVLTLCVALLLYQKGFWNQYGFIQQTIGYSLTPALYACLLIMILTSEAISRVFSNGILRYLGKYSYAIYVIHPFVIAYLTPFFRLGVPNHFSILSAIAGQSRAFGFLDGVSYIAAVAGISMAAALISWKLIEQPFLNLKKYFPYEKPNPAEGSDLVLTLAENTGAVSTPKDLTPG